MRIICLGTGTSYGVPIVACPCSVCHSADPRNRRFRCSVAVALPQGTLLIDTPPELRLACLRDGIHRIDAVALTHTHADHVMGMDDIRRFNDIKCGAIPILAEPRFLGDIRRIFAYVFTDGQEGGGKPKMELQAITPGQPVDVLGASVLPLRILHGELPITAYRIGDFAYVTDVSEIPNGTMDRLRDLDILILGAIRDKPHATHFSIPQALDVVKELQPRRAFFTHMTHDVEYTELLSRLPDGVFPAYDGLVLDTDDPAQERVIE